MSSCKTDNESFSQPVALTSGSTDSAKYFLIYDKKFVINKYIFKNTIILVNLKMTH